MCVFRLLLPSFAETKSLHRSETRLFASIGGKTEAMGIKNHTTSQYHLCSLTPAHDGDVPIATYLVRPTYISVHVEFLKGDGHQNPVPEFRI